MLLASVAMLSVLASPAVIPRPLDSSMPSKRYDSGVAACRLHGNRTESFEDGLRNFCAAAWLMFEGPLLRLRKDGSVQTAKLTLDRSSLPGAGRGFSLWNLFTDEPNPFQNLELRAEEQ